MKNILRKPKPFKKVALSTLFGLTLPLSFTAQAATLDDVVKSIDQLKEGVVNWLNTAKELYLDQLYEESPSFPTTLAANTSESAVGSSIKQKMNELALPVIKDMLTQQDSERTVRLLAAAPASDTFQTSKTQQPFSISGQNKKPNIAEGDAYLYAGTLLSPLAYSVGKNADNDQVDSNNATNPNTSKAPSAKAAFGFLQFAAGLGQPTGEINLSKLTDKQKELLETTEAGRNYKVFMRSMIAARSVALDNLLKIYTRRLPIPGLGEAAGIPNQKDASAAEVEHYLATRRASNPEWYKDMAKASEATVARETLNVLVEIQRQLYESNRYNEQILATLSIMELQSLEANKEAQKSKVTALREALGIR